MQATMQLRASGKMQAARPAPQAAVVPRVQSLRSSRRVAQLQPVCAVVADFDAKVRIEEGC